MDIVIIGNEDFTLGFKLAGVKRSIGASTPEEYEKEISSIIKDQDAGLVIVEQSGYDSLTTSLKNRLEQLSRPVIFPIGGKSNINIREHIIKVVGVDLWK